MMSVLFLFLTLARAEVSPKPAWSLTLARPNAVGATLRRVQVSRRGAKPVYTLVIWRSGDQPTRRVIPPSLARRLDAEARQWTVRLASARSLASLGCAESAELTRGPRSISVCLDAAGIRARRDLNAWFVEATAWLE